MGTKVGEVSAAGLPPISGESGAQILGFADAVLRGIGQVMLQNNRYAGVLFLLGIFYNSLLFGQAVLLGCAVSTLAAMLLGAERAQIRDGLFGFNGALVGIGLLYFLEPGLLSTVYVILAAACSSVVMAGLMRIFALWKAPALTAPFVLTTWVFILAHARFGRLASTEALPTAGLPKLGGAVEGVVTQATLAEGVLNGVAQVFFQASPVTGALFLVGLLISSRPAALAAFLGSLAGALVAWGLGAAEPAIRSGAFGFNSVLTAVAIAGVFFVIDKSSLTYALLASVVSAVMFAAVSAALEPIGMPAMTAPFVLTTWVFVLAGPLFARLRVVGATAA